MIVLRFKQTCNEWSFTLWPDNIRDLTDTYGQGIYTTLLKRHSFNHMLYEKRNNSYEPDVNCSERYV